MRTSLGGVVLQTVSRRIGRVHIRLNRRNAQPARSVSVVPLPSLHCAPPPPLFYWYLLHPFWSISPWMFDAAGSRSHKQFVSEGWSLQCHLPTCWPVQHCPGLGVTTGTALAVLGGPPWCQKTSPPPYRTRCRGLGIPKYPPGFEFWVLAKTQNCKSFFSLGFWLKPKNTTVILSLSFEF